MVRLTATLFSAGALAALAVPSAAQTAGFTTIPVTFTGTVSNDPRQTIRIQVPGAVVPAGQPVPTVPYTGPLPDFPLKPGDTIKLTFNVTAPTKDFFASPAYTGQVAADGIYKLQVYSAPPRDANGVVAPLGTYATSSNPAMSSPFFNPSSGTPSVSGYTLVYDANAGTFSLAFPAALNGAGSAGWDAPTFNYDYATDRVGLADSSCFVEASCSQVNTGGRYSFQIGENGGYAAGAVLGTTTNLAPVVGFFDLLFGGSWSLPTWSGSGSPTPVPEPGSTLLFATAALAVIARRQRQTRSREQAAAAA